MLAFPQFSPVISTSITLAALAGKILHKQEKADGIGAASQFRLCV